MGVKRRDPSFARILLRKYNRTQHEWGLIKHAVNASQQAYEEVPEMNNGQYFKAKNNVKAMIAYVDEVDGRRILIIGVRGTVTKDDWMLNVNNAPKKSSMVGLCITCSAGYLLTVPVAPTCCCLARRVPDRCEGNGKANRQGNSRYQGKAV